jgi:hypothetical protein
MVAEGLSGEYCWAVSLGSSGNRQRSRRVRAPESPTEEELAAAKAWQVEHRVLAGIRDAEETHCE